MIDLERIERNKKFQMTAREKYEAFKAEYESARKKFISESKKAFREIAAGVFEQVPSMESFGWTQYTPYFNDGDECIFSVNHYDDGIYINGLNSYDDESDDYQNDDDEQLCSNCEAELVGAAKFCAACGTTVQAKVEEPLLDKQTREKAADLVSQMLRMFDDDILQDVYGDHCLVTIHRNGRAEVKEYSHD